MFALIKALTIHILIIGGIIWFLGHLPAPEPEHRIQMSLLHALPQRRIAPTTPPPPLPQSIPDTSSPHTPPQLPSRAIHTPTLRSTVTTPLSTPTTLPSTPISKPSSTTPSNTSLYSWLSRPDGSASSLTTRTSNNVKELYGDLFDQLTPEQKRYILDNQETMRRITQNVLNRYAPTRIPNGFHQDDSDTIEFYLYPDGHISDVRIIQNSRYTLLDDITEQTIRLAYGQYPHPTTKTLIRYRVWYNFSN